MDITKIKSLIVPLMYVKTTVEQGGFTQAARYLGKNAAAYQQGGEKAGETF